MYEELAKKLIDESKHIVIATVAEDGRPWAVVVGKVGYENGVFSWQSMTDADHSVAIVSNQNIAIMLYRDRETLKLHAKARKVSGGDVGFATYEAIMTDAKYGAPDRTNHWLDVERLRGL